MVLYQGGEDSVGIEGGKRRGSIGAGIELVGFSGGGDLLSQLKAKDHKINEVMQNSQLVEARLQSIINEREDQIQKMKKQASELSKKYKEDSERMLSQEVQLIYNS